MTLPLPGILLVVGLLFAVVGREHRNRCAPNLCSRCGYDVRGCVEARCSECGTPFRKASERQLLAAQCRFRRARAMHRAALVAGAVAMVAWLATLAYEFVATRRYVTHARSHASSTQEAQMVADAARSVRARGTVSRIVSVSARQHELSWIVEFAHEDSERSAVMIQPGLDPQVLENGIAELKRAEIEEQVRAEVMNRVQAEMLNQLRARILNQAGAETSDQVRAEMLDRAREEIADRVQARMMEAIGSTGSPRPGRAADTSASNLVP